MLDRTMKDLNGYFMKDRDNLYNLLVNPTKADYINCAKSISINSIKGLPLLMKVKELKEDPFNSDKFIPEWEKTNVNKLKSLKPYKHPLYYYRRAIFNHSAKDTYNTGTKPTILFHITVKVENGKRIGYCKPYTVRTVCKLTFLKSGKIKWTPLIKRYQFSKNDPILDKLARIGANAGIKAKSLQSVAWIDKIRENDYKDNQINGISFEDVCQSAIENVIKYDGINYYKTITIEGEDGKPDKKRIITNNPYVLAMRGANNLLNILQSRIASNVALDGGEWQAKKAELAKEKASQQEPTKTNSTNENKSERRKYIKSDSVPMNIEQELIKKEKIEYIFSHMTKDEVKLFKVWAEQIERVKNRETGKYYTARVNLSVIRKRMNYSKTLDRSTIGKRLHSVINRYRDLSKSYDTISKNLVSYTDNETILDNIKLNASITAYSRKKVKKVRFNLAGLIKVHKNFMETYRNIADNERSYETAINPIKPNWNYTIPAESFRTSRDARLSRLINAGKASSFNMELIEQIHTITHDNVKVLSLSDRTVSTKKRYKYLNYVKVNETKMERTEHLTNMFNPFAK